jgi:hypothetical protein
MNGDFGGDSEGNDRILLQRASRHNTEDNYEKLQS